MYTFRLSNSKQIWRRLERAANESIWNSRANTNDGWRMFASHQVHTFHLKTNRTTAKFLTQSRKSVMNVWYFSFFPCACVYFLLVIPSPVLSFYVVTAARYLSIVVLLQQHICMLRSIEDEECGQLVCVVLFTCCFVSALSYFFES